MGSDPSDEKIIKEFWNVTKKHKDNTDPTRSLINLNSDIYTD